MCGGIAFATGACCVAHSLGRMVQVNYGTKVLECVFKLHDGPIHSVAINEGFCVTASADRFLRVWPLDFSDFFLEAHVCAAQRVWLVACLHLSALWVSRRGQHSAIVERTARLSTNVSLRMLSTGDSLFFAPFSHSLSISHALVAVVVCSMRTR